MKDFLSNFLCKLILTARLIAGISFLQLGAKLLKFLYGLRFEFLELLSETLLD